MGMGRGSSKSSKSKRTMGVWCVVLMGLLLAAAAEGLSCRDECDENYRGGSREWRYCNYQCSIGTRLHLKRFPAGEAEGAMVAKGGLPTVRFSECDVWCDIFQPNMNRRLCIQNLCPYDKTPKSLSAGEAQGAMVAKGGLPAVRFSECDIWCDIFQPNMNRRLCIQNLCPYDKTPKSLSAGEAEGAMVAKGGLPVVRFSDCDVWCDIFQPNMNRRLCIQNLCPYDKTPKSLSAGEAQGAMVAKGGLPAVRFSECDVWCDIFQPNMNCRLCVQNLCPYDKTPKSLSVGEEQGARVAKGGLPTVRFSECDVWCDIFQPNMNRRLCVQNLCPYDKTPKAKLIAPTGDIKLQESAEVHVTEAEPAAGLQEA